MGLPSVWVCCAWWVHREGSPWVCRAWARRGFAVPGLAVGLPCLGSPWVCRGWGNHSNSSFSSHSSLSLSLAWLFFSNGFVASPTPPPAGFCSLMVFVLTHVVAIGFTDSGFVGLPVMVLGVIAGPIWLILSLVVGFVQWVSMGYEVGHGGFLWGVWLAVGRGGLRVFLGGFVGWLTVVEQLTVCLGWL
uniref:Uncharacterized protein n=1 Tax=Fagus sylvatica TaxID=28930 RepID=A0A2N9GSL5_FAGSY